jgi:hypothetical protein
MINGEAVISAKMFKV